MRNQASRVSARSTPACAIARQSPRRSSFNVCLTPTLLSPLPLPRKQQPAVPLDDNGQLSDQTLVAEALGSVATGKDPLNALICVHGGNPPDLFDNSSYPGQVVYCRLVLLQVLEYWRLLYTHPRYWSLLYTHPHTNVRRLAILEYFLHPPAHERAEVGDTGVFSTPTRTRTCGGWRYWSLLYTHPHTNVQRLAMPHP